MKSVMGASVRPKSVIEYSTLGGNLHKYLAVNQNGSLKVP